jgi:hypothetical protein
MLRTILICLIVVVVPLAADTIAQERLVEIDAVVSVDSVEVTKGSTFSVQVRLSNNTYEFGALEVPLQFQSPDLVLDTVLFDGTIKPDGMNAFVGAVNMEDAARIFYLPEVGDPLPAITANSGIIAELVFTVSADASPQVITIDSIFRDDGIPIRLSFPNTAGDTTYLPQFRPGAVVVKAATAIEDEMDGGLLPGDFALAQNYPNPFNPATTIEFALPRAGRARLAVFNILGQEVTVLQDHFLTAGVHRVEWDAGDKPSGIYFYRLTYDGHSQTKKMAFVK